MHVAVAVVMPDAFVATFDVLAVGDKGNLGFDIIGQDGGRWGYFVGTSVF